MARALVPSACAFGRHGGRNGVIYWRVNEKNLLQTGQTVSLIIFFFTSDCALPSNCKKGNTETCTFDGLNASKGVQCDECEDGYFIAADGQCQGVL